MRKDDCEGKWESLSLHARPNLSRPIIFSCPAQERSSAAKSGNPKMHRKRAWLSAHHSTTPLRSQFHGQGNPPKISFRLRKWPLLRLTSTLLQVHRDDYLHIPRVPYSSSAVKGEIDSSPDKIMVPFRPPLPGIPNAQVQQRQQHSGRQTPTAVPASSP